MKPSLQPIHAIAKMADDPERDILPVKEGASCERQRNISTSSLIGGRDTLHAPYVSKLDRKELEDRYLCLMFDNNHLKKECNKQREKIKRLAAKLLRLLAEQKRDIPTAAQRHDHNLECTIVEQQQQIRELQQNNNQLQDRLTVLRNQLVEHTSVHSAVHCNFMGKLHSPARSTRAHTRTYTPNSRIQTVVSSRDSQKTETPPQHLGRGAIEDCERLNTEQSSPDIPDTNATVAQQNQKLSEELMRLHEQISILEQDLETQLEQSSARIGELEYELANTVAQDQRQKLAENVEMIRLQRSLQQQSAHLAAQTAKNQVLEREVARLRQELETLQQESDELQHQLMNEHQKVANLQQELQGVGSNQLSIRELHEQIRDIQNERSTLKEHNERLLALMSSRQSQNSEQEVALQSQVAQLECMLAKERNEHAQLMQRVEQLQLEVQNQAHLQPCLGEEKALRIQVAQLEAALATELKERSSLLQTLHEMQQKMSEPKDPCSSDKESAVHIQVTQLETTLAKELSNQTQMLQNLEDERTQVAALKVAHSDLLVKLQDLQAQQTNIESQLQKLQQEKSKSLPEEGFQTSGDSVRLKILDNDLWQNDEVNTMALHPGEDRTTTANQLDICRELEKCRELLRVQYNLNSMYKKEIASLAQQLNQSEDEKAREVDEMSKLLHMQTAHITKLQSQLGTSKLDSTARDTGHLTIGVGEGLFEIHIQCLQLSPEGLGSLVDESCDDVYQRKELPSLFLTWIFYNQDVAYTPVKRAETSVEFDSSSVHRVTVNDEFLEYLEKDGCVIEVHMTVDDASETVARGTIHFSELLRFPQKKIHSTVPLATTRSHKSVVSFGIVHCWFQLRCSASHINNYMQHRTTDKVTKTKIPIPAPRQKKEQTSTEISHLDSNTS